MSELPVVVEADTPHHWIGHIGDLVLVFVREGAHDDDSHVRAGAKLVDRLSRARGATVRFMLVPPPQSSRPPSAKVRGAFLEEGKRLEGRISRMAMVVLGSGFAAAIQRGALTGILVILRPKAPIKVMSDFESALDFLLDEKDAAIRAPLLELCQERVGKRGT